MDPINKLSEIFARFPGIGPRQAKRFVYHLLNQGEIANKQLAELVLSLKTETSSCLSCNRFFRGKRNTSLCNICESPERDRERLMIIAKDVDMESVERSGAYKGLYFILGGLIPILDKEPSQRIRQTELMGAIQKMPNLKEIILALSASTEGDYTADYLKLALAPIAKEKNIKITVLGRGLSTGTELEYSDSDTIKNALKNRE